MEDRLLDAAVIVLAKTGWDGLTLDRVADQAGISRVTAWRQGASKQAIIDGLITRLAEDYQAAMWRVLINQGTGRTRLLIALRTLCEVVDRHTALLLASDTVFHHEPSTRAPRRFTEPLARLLTDAAADGSLPAQGDTHDRATVLFNLVCWPYLHLRARHGWTAAKAQHLILQVVLPDPERVAEQPPRGTPSAKPERRARAAKRTG
jgi:AcrR family transcriptional regulator